MTSKSVLDTTSKTDINSYDISACNGVFGHWMGG